MGRSLLFIQVSSLGKHQTWGPAGDCVWSNAIQQFHQQSLLPRQEGQAERLCWRLLDVLLPRRSKGSRRMRISRCQGGQSVVTWERDVSLRRASTDYTFTFPVKDTLEVFGMEIDNKLNFSSHISNVCKRINNQFNVMLRFRKLIPRDTLQSVHLATFLLLLFCLAFLWGAQYG